MGALLFVLIALILLGGILLMFVILTLVTKPTSCWHCKYYDHGYCSLHKKEVKGNDTPCDDGEIEMNYGNPYSF
jgi:hypothetical protein